MILVLSYDRSAASPKGKGGKSAAVAYTLIETAKLNGVDPQAWLTDVLGCIADHKNESGVPRGQAALLQAILEHEYKFPPGSLAERAPGVIAKSRALYAAALADGD